MKTFETLAEVIDNAIAVHDRASDLYTRLRGACAEPRVQMVLEDIDSHVVHQKRLMKDLVSRTSPGVLRAYLQYTLEQPPAKFIDSITPAGDVVTIEDVTRIGHQVHQYTVELFESALRGTGSRDGCDLLRDLLQLQSAEYRHLNNNINSAGDI